jgi:hypothetical protein
VKLRAENRIIVIKVTTKPGWELRMSMGHASTPSPPLSFVSAWCRAPGEGVDDRDVSVHVLYQYPPDVVSIRNVELADVHGAIIQPDGLVGLYIWRLRVRHGVTKKGILSIV